MSPGSQTVDREVLELTRNADGTYNVVENTATPEAPLKVEIVKPEEPEMGWWKTFGSIIVLNIVGLLLCLIPFVFFVALPILAVVDGLFILMTPFWFLMWCFGGTKNES